MPRKRVTETVADLADPGAPEQVMNHAVREFGHMDVPVRNHGAPGGDGALGELTAQMLDAHWAINTRSALLLAQAFAAQHEGRPGGRVVLMTSGQGMGPCRLAGRRRRPLDDRPGAQHRGRIRPLAVTCGGADRERGRSAPGCTVGSGCTSA